MWRVNRTRRRWLLVAVVAVIVCGGAVSYLASSDSDVAPIAGLRQLDLLYLDEPAPGLVLRPRLRTPDLAGAQVVHSSDPDLAARYALLTATGRVGPGYALVDGTGQLRYRTFDPAPGAHAEEIQILVDAVRGDR